MKHIGGCGIGVFKEELAWVNTDKQFQFTISYYTIPLDSYLQRSYRLAINNFQLSKLQYFSYLNAFEMKKYIGVGYPRVYCTQISKPRISVDFTVIS